MASHTVGKLCSPHLRGVSHGQEVPFVATCATCQRLRPDGKGKPGKSADELRRENTRVFWVDKYRARKASAT